MKFKVVSEKDTEDIVEFWLAEKDDKIFLNAKKSGANQVWNILSISKNGLYLYAGIVDNLGFPKTDTNKIFNRNYSMRE